VGARGLGLPRLGPVDIELALGEQPGAADLDEVVEVAKGGDHQLARSVLGEQVVGQAVALAGRAIAVQGDRALPVEVGPRLVAVEVVEDRRQSLPAVELSERAEGVLSHD
jgi:hypothetical protein